MDIHNSNTLYIGGYLEQGDPTRCRLTYPRTSQREAERDALSAAEPHPVVLEVEIVGCTPVGSKPKPPIRSAYEARKS